MFNPSIWLTTEFLQTATWFIGTLHVSWTSVNWVVKKGCKARRASLAKEDIQCLAADTVLASQRI